MTLKGSFISLTELAEYTEKDNYHFSFAAEAPAHENRYAWQGIGCQNLPPGLIDFFFPPSRWKEKNPNLCDLCGLKRSGRENPKYTTLPAENAAHRKNNHLCIGN
jgi:hypothetical protein